MAAGLKAIKTRIGSVKSTGQMTKAMKMVSTARLRGAQNRILNLRDYARALERVLADIVLSQSVRHPFLEQKKNLKRVLFVVVTSDRGLCAGFNGNICRFVEKVLSESKYETKDLFFVGKKGLEYFKFRGYEGKDQIFNLTKEVSYTLAARLARQLMDFLVSGNYEGVYIIYNEFKTLITPRVVSERVLPFDLHSEFLSKKSEKLSPENFIFEVSPEKLLKTLLDRYFSTQIYRCLCESVAAEHGARMAAMENATKNADEMLSNLTLTYNKLRQSAITTELTEIVAGVEALK